MYCAGSKFNERTVCSTSRCLQSAVLRTRPTTSSRMSVQTMSTSSSWTIVTAMRRCMPWCSRNVPVPGMPSEWSTLHAVYLSINVNQSVLQWQRSCATHSECSSSSSRTYRLTWHKLNMIASRTRYTNCVWRVCTLAPMLCWELCSVVLQTVKILTSYVVHMVCL